MMRPVLLFAGLGVLALTLAACGGGEAQPSPSPTTGAPMTAAPMTTVTAADQSQAEALAKAATLQVGDLPQGFVLKDEQFTTNEQAAQRQSGLPNAPTVDDLNRWGRMLGYEATYTAESLSGTGTLIVQTATHVYRDADGANQYFDAFRQLASSDSQLLQAASGIFQQAQEGEATNTRDVTLSRLSFPEIADGQLAFELKVTAYVGTIGAAIDEYTSFFAIRQGRGIATVLTMALGSPTPEQDLLNLARASDERLKGALG